MILRNFERPSYTPINKNRQNYSVLYFEQQKAKKNATILKPIQNKMNIFFSICMTDRRTDKAIPKEFFLQLFLSDVMPNHTQD